MMDVGRHPNGVVVFGEIIGGFVQLVGSRG